MINLKDSDILSKALVGVEFEFYSNTSIEDTAKEVGKILGKKIRVEKKAHSEFQPTQDEFKMEPDMSGGAGLIELVTGAVPYSAGRLMIIKMCDWIKKNGYTTDRSSIHLNLSFDPNDSPKWINQCHIEAWKLGIKTLYYLRTDSVIKGDLGSRMADCVSCEG